MFRRTALKLVTDSRPPSAGGSSLQATASGVASGSVAAPPLCRTRLRWPSPRERSCLAGAERGTE